MCTHLISFAGVRWLPSSTSSGLFICFGSFPCHSITILSGIQTVFHPLRSNRLKQMGWGREAHAKLLGSSKAIHLRGVGGAVKGFWKTGVNRRKKNWREGSGSMKRKTTELEHKLLRRVGKQVSNGIWRENVLGLCGDIISGFLFFKSVKLTCIHLSR